MSRPKNETLPVLRTMQIRMRELASELERVAMLPAQVRHYENRFERLQESVKALRARLDAMPGGATTGRTVPGMTLAPGPTAAGSRGEADVPGNPTMDLGIGLLERGQYATARELFQRLQLAQPNDARVWYLSALAEGLTSGDWNGTAQKLAQRGLECERADNPPTARIDSALATHTPIKGQEWIASLRHRVLNSRSPSKDQ